MNLISGVVTFEVFDDGTHEEVLSDICCNHLFIEAKEEIDCDKSILTDLLPKEVGVYAITFVASIIYIKYDTRDGVDYNSMIELVFNDVRQLSLEESKALQIEQIQTESNDPNKMFHMSL